METTGMTELDDFLYSIWNFFELNLSKNTRKNYYNVVKNYISIIGKTPLKLTEEDSNKYYQYLSEKIRSKQLSYNTAVMRISVLRTLCEYIRKKEASQGKDYINYFRDIVLQDLDKTLEPDDLPSEKDLNNLLEMTIDEQDYLCFILFSLVIKCGLTCNEVTSIKIEYLAEDNDGNICICFPEKKRITRIIRLPEDISNLIYNYIKLNNIKEEYIFLNKRKTQLKVRDAERLLKKYVDVGLKNKKLSRSFTIQTLRHAALKYMLLGGASETDVAKYTGITTKWMGRYRKVVNQSGLLTAADHSLITVKMPLINNK